MLYFSHLKSRNIIHGVTEKKETFPKETILGEQIHTDQFAFVQKKSPKKIAGVDALLTKESGVSIAVRTADCVPILFFDPRTGIVGTIHAGWRGTALEVSRKAIQAIGADPYHVLVGMGPAICSRCFEVGQEVAVQFDRRVVKKKEDRWYVDLWEANILQLLDLGVQRKNIEVIDLCTYENEQLYSFRRGDRNAHHFSYIEKK